MAAARRSVLLGHLPVDDLATVLRAARAVSLARGALALRADDDAVLVVLAGAAKEHRPSAGGTEVLTGVLGPGDTAGLTVALGRPSGGDVTVLEALDGLLLSGRELRDLLRTRPGVTHACLRAVTEQLAEARDRQVAFAGTSTTERVVHRLLELTVRWGEPVDGVVMVRLHLTQEELASWAGVSRESLAKVLGELRRSRIVHTGRRELIVRDLPALQGKRPQRRVQGRGVVDTLLAALEQERRATGTRTEPA